jgi:hypothetical protein
MMKVIALLSISLLVFAFGTGAQPQAQQSSNAAAPEQVRTARHEPTPPGQVDWAERGRQAHEKMEKYVEVKITPVAYRGVAFSNEPEGYFPTTAFKAGSSILISITMTNRSDETLTTFHLTEFLHERLRLIKDGVPMHYLHDVPVKMKAADDNAGTGVVSLSEVALAPNVETVYHLLNLRDWYGTLQPGHYELTIKHRFRAGGKQVESNTVNFEVTP